MISVLLRDFMILTISFSPCLYVVLKYVVSSKFSMMQGGTDFDEGMIGSKEIILKLIPLQYSCLENPMDGGAW